MRGTHWSIKVACLVVWATMIGAGCCIAETPTSAGQPVLLQMIRDEAVQLDLRFSDQQKEKVLLALRSVDGPWFRSRNLKVLAREREISKLVGQLEAKLK